MNYDYYKLNTEIYRVRKNYNKSKALFIITEVYLNNNWVNSYMTIDTLIKFMKYTEHNTIRHLNKKLTENELFAEML